MTEESLDKKIEETERTLRELKRKKIYQKIDKYIRPLDSYTNFEKIDWFDKTYRISRKSLFAQLNRTIEDHDVMMEETWNRCMDLLGKKVWDLWNRVT